MQVGILGPLDVRDAAGGAVNIAGSRLRAVLVRLALDAGRPVSVGTLVDAVWTGVPPTDEANALQTLMSRLRRVLPEPGAVVQSAAGYRLAIDREDVDAHRFQTLALAGAAALRDGAASRAADLLHQALALWRAPELDDLERVAPGQARRLRELRLAAVVDRLDAELQLGRAAAVCTELEGLCGEHPLNERLAGQLVTALAATGRQAEALAGYERLRTRLADELGVDPCPALQAIHLAVLRGEAGAALPAPAAVRRTNLRAQLTSFVGRDAEVARIAKSLEQYRLVTVVGPGGAGKTRLASEAVARIVDEVPDGVWFVELASLTDAADLPQTVLGSLGLREAHLIDRPQKLTVRDAVSRLLEGLGDKRAVVVLDNCEHLIEASARLADTLLARCPNLRIVTTSREPLGILGESLLALPPLGQPPADAPAVEALDFPAVRLFADRAAAVLPGFAVDARTVATVVEIVRRLDGLPLAIELAAARLRTLPLGEIAARLSDRFRLLTGGSRTALPRHRTLRAVVEWSWDLLTPAERTLAERFSVFPSGATPAAVEAVCVGEADAVPAEEAVEAVGAVGALGALELIASLVDKSLLQPTSDRTRMRMLETIREYGSERVAARGELAELRAAHARYFSQLMAQADPHLTRREQLEWLAVAAQERDNVLAALRFWCDVGDADAALALAARLGRMALLLGNHADVAAWIAEALAVPGGSDADLRTVGEALYALNTATSGLATTVPGDVQQALDRIRVLVTELADVDVCAHPIAGLLKPAIAMIAEQDELSQRWSDEAVAGPDPWVAAAARMFRAHLSENNGDVEGMRADTAAALTQFRALGERWGLASTLHTVGLLHTLDGELGAAEAAYTEALSLLQEMGSREDEAFLLVRLADLSARQGDLGRARQRVAAARAGSEASGSPMEAILTLTMAAGIERLAGNLDEAQRLQRSAMEHLDAIPAGHPILVHLSALARSLAVQIACDRGELTTAGEQARDAYAASLATKDLPIVSMCGVSAAGLAADLGRPTDAAQMLGAAATLRGSEDPTDLAIVAVTRRLRTTLGAEAFAAAYAEGREMDRTAALARLDPAGVTAPPAVGGAGLRLDAPGHARRR